MITQYEIGVIGAGNAAEGVVASLLRRSILLDDRIIASDPDPQRRSLFADRFGIAVTDDNRHLVDNSYLIILAVKPQIHREVIAGFADRLRNDHVLVSIMAGVSTATIEAQFKHLSARVVRVMPNLPMHVGEGMAAVCRGKHCSDNDLLHARRIFDAGARTLLLEDESLMDVVTAVSGSGPAYFYYFVDAIVAAGESAGLSHEQAVLLATQSCLGAARMMIESSDPPSVLRKKVMSPGGTTEAAFDSMSANHVFEHIKDGVLAAHKRSLELGH
jgi:pyrroline-5-carboxylate reductase